MEEEVYGIDKNHAHPRAIELVQEEFFWSCVDDNGPFGSDEADTALAEFREWKIENPNKPVINCLIWTIESISEKPVHAYNKELLLRETIQSQIDDEDFDDHYEFFTLDISVIATGFGQLVDEGIIDAINKPLIQIAIERQKIWTELSTDQEEVHRNEYISNLIVLERVLKEA